MARYTLEEKIKIGQETFYRLLETEYGENVRLKDIRKNSSELTDDFWDLIRNERKRLFAEGLSTKEVADYISETYFGSP